MGNATYILSQGNVTSCGRPCLVEITRMEKVCISTEEPSKLHTKCGVVLLM